MGTPEQDAVTVLVCRDCCCGTRRKHPDVDHDAQLEAMEAAVERAGVGRVRVVGCLDVCERSNVVVLRWNHGEQSQTVWLGEVLHRRRVEALCGWLAAGGPRSAPLPSALALARFVPPPKSARTVERACQGDGGTQERG
jgi:hypothetical protein